MESLNIEGGRCAGIGSGMHVNQKLKVLDRLYRIYDEFVAGLDIACRRACASCCTRNVTLSTLEGYSLLIFLESEGKHAVMEKIAAQASRKRFIPKITINQMARSSMEGKELPLEAADPQWGPCPILEENECPLYPVRPFACRCLTSKRNCRETGYAEMDEFVITVNTVFLQCIEHVDKLGCSGNFSDVLLRLAPKQHRVFYAQEKLTCHRDGLLPNHSLKAYMIPPEHRERVKPILQKIYDIR